MRTTLYLCVFEGRDNSFFYHIFAWNNQDAEILAKANAIRDGKEYNNVPLKISKIS